MAIEIKTTDGTTERAATAGQGNLATVLGAIGTGLGVLNTGVLGNGILGGVNGNGVFNKECLVDKDQFYTTLLAQANENATRDINTERRFSALEAAISVNTTANQYQNTIIHNQFEWERLLSEKNLALATCRCIQGQVYLPSSMLADSYISPTRVLESHEARPYREARGFDGNCGPCNGGF